MAKTSALTPRISIPRRGVVPSADQGDVEGGASASPAHVDPERLRRALERLGRDGGAATNDDAGLERVVMAACEVFRVDGAGVMLADDAARLVYVASTDDAARALEEAQEDTGEGPCIESYLRGQAVDTGDVLADERWPRLAARLAGSEVRGG